MTLVETLRHARTRFECLAEDFNKAGDTVSWAMCSVDAGMMDKAIAALGDSVVVPQPIVTAPKDGTLVDLFHKEFGRHADCYWGRPDHVCGEAGQYCDSDWHGLAEGWVCGTFNECLDAEDFTHWMPRPAAPAATPQDSTP